MRVWFRRRARVEDELRFHRDRLIEDLVARGHDRAAAERRAFLQFGNVAAIQESVRDVRGRWVDDLVKDLLYACRTLRRSPGFAAVAVLSLTLGIGANSAIFSLVNALILQSLPVEQPERLVRLGRMTPRSGIEGLAAGRPAFVSYPVFEHFRDNLRSISGAFAQGSTVQSIVVNGEDDFVTADLVSGDYARVVGLRPGVGRLLGPADDVPSPETPAVVISDGYWQRRFGRSPSAIGGAITVRGRVFTIVGVTPTAYRGAQSGRAADLMLPLAVMMTNEQRQSFGSNNLGVLARLAPGATVEQANAEVGVLFDTLIETRSRELPERVRAQVLRQRAIAAAAPDGFNPIRDVIQQPLLMLMGIVGLILLLACVNLSGLLLARAAARQREVSIRLAIGAGRGRLVRQFLTESLVLALIGGSLGLALAGRFSVRLFDIFVGAREIALSVTPDWRVATFTAVVSLVACIAAGLVPALRAVRANVNPGLKEVRAHGHGRFGKALVVAQFAISTILVVGATLFVGTLVKLYAVERGFDSEGILVVNVRSSRLYPPDRALALQQALLNALRGVPGVRSAGAAQMLPAGGSLWDRTVEVEGYAFRREESNSVGFNVVTPDYFATLGTPLVAGREFNDRDTTAAPKAAIVNESFARYFFADRSAIGRHVASLGVTYEIVGVVRDAKYQSLRDATLRTLYVAWAQRSEDQDQPASYRYLARVDTGDPTRLAPSLELLVRGLDPALRLRTAVTYASIIEDQLAIERTLGTLGGLFGLLALVLAGLGLFGVLAFQVARRTNEIGVRMVLGAGRWSMARQVVRDVVAMLVPGVAVGSAAAFAAAGVAERIVYGFTPTAPGVFAVAAAVLSLAAVLAGALPAYRASRIDPLAALRHE